MGSLQERKSSSLKKPDIAITASSFYLKETLPTSSVITKKFSNSSMNETSLEGDEGDEQSNLILNENDKKTTFDIPKKTSSVNMKNAEDLTSLPSNSLNKKNSIL